MKILCNQGFGETRWFQVADDDSTVDVRVVRDLTWNYGDVAEARLTAYQAAVRGYFAQTDRGDIFIPGTNLGPLGTVIPVQIDREAYQDKCARGRVAETPVIRSPIAEWEGPDMPPIQDISDAEADERIALAMSADVPVAGGGLLHIERTRVGWTLDVDTGNGSDGRAVNTAAVSEIRRQIVLKNMGGLILIDLAGSKRTAYRRQWDQALRQVGNEMTTIYGWTRAGLYEIGRRRGRASLWDTQADTLPVCVYYRVRRALARCRSGRLVVHAAPAVVDLLTRARIRAVPVFDKPISYFEIQE